jgi:hypothetical protein
MVPIPDPAHRARRRQRVERPLEPDQLAEAVAAVGVAELRPPPAPHDVWVVVADGGLAAFHIAGVLELELLAQTQEVLFLELDAPVLATAGHAEAAADIEGPLVVSLHRDLDPAVDAPGRDQDRVDEAQRAQGAGALLGKLRRVRVSLLEQQHRPQKGLLADDVEGVRRAVEPLRGLRLRRVKDVEALEDDTNDRLAFDVAGLVRGNCGSGERQRSGGNQGGSHGGGEDPGRSDRSAPAPSAAPGQGPRRLRVASRSRTSSATC